MSFFSGYSARGGDQPIATFAIRAVVFAVFAFFFLSRPFFVIRLNPLDALVFFLWAFGAVSLARAGYKWISYQWFLHHSAALFLYVLLRALPEADMRFPPAAAALLLFSAVAQIALVLFQRFF